MEYVPGSTEYATEFKVDNNKQIAKKWIPIPDNGGFPLESGFKVADTMDFCDAGSDYLSCSDLIMVRFKAKVKSGTPNTQFWKIPQASILQAFHIRPTSACL